MPEIVYGHVVLFYIIFILFEIILFKKARKILNGFFGHMLHIKINIRILFLFYFHILHFYAEIAHYDNSVPAVFFSGYGPEMKFVFIRAVKHGSS